MGDASFTCKTCVVVSLVAQNSFYNLAMRYAKHTLREQWKSYTVVWVAEVVKLFFCVIFIECGLGESVFVTGVDSRLKGKSCTQRIQYLIRRSTLLSVPALIYFVQNAVQYYALEHLPTAVFSVLVQLKILTAAIFSVGMLERKLSAQQWRALCLLILGAILVQKHMIDRKPSSAGSDGNPFFGTIAVLVQVSLSGLAGVYFEKVLKRNQDPDEPKLGIWDRNFQLALWSVLFGLPPMIYDFRHLQANGLFFGWSRFTIVLVLLGAVGGLLVGMTVRYTNVIIKGFVTTFALVIISLMGAFVMGDELDIIFAVGAAVTIIATFNYNDACGKKEKAHTPMRKDDPELGKLATAVEKEALMSRVELSKKVDVDLSSRIR